MQGYPTRAPLLTTNDQLTRNVKQPHHHIKLSSGFFKDLEIWKQFIISWNGAGFFLSSEWTNSEALEFHTDASGTLGYGGIFENMWFYGEWEPHQRLGQHEISLLGDRSTYV